MLLFQRAPLTRIPGALYREVLGQCCSSFPCSASYDEKIYAFSIVQPIVNVLQVRNVVVLLNHELMAAMEGQHG